MRFDNGIANRYIRSIEDAFNTILEKGNNLQKEIASQMLESRMLFRVQPVSELNASGVTGLIEPDETNEKIADEILSLREALGEIYIAIAEETIDNGGQRGCEGTIVHEGRHAYDFARTISSFSNARVNPISLFDPTLYELELEAHRISGDYMLCVSREDYIEEGLGLMILGLNPEDGACYVNNSGIDRRLRESYGLTSDINPGPSASQLLGLRFK